LVQVPKAYCREASNGWHDQPITNPGHTPPVLYSLLFMIKPLIPNPGLNCGSYPPPPSDPSRRPPSITTGTTGRKSVWASKGSNIQLTSASLTEKHVQHAKKTAAPKKPKRRKLPQTYNNSSSCISHDRQRPRTP
jgi:hypothetical protein